jgi:succinate-semialdehyde dehydrogenase/glutarate-semialdehyde dehydrogenase
MPPRPRCRTGARSPPLSAPLLKNWHRLILENKTALAQIMTAEQGKPLAEAEGEIAYAASFIEWFAEQGKRANGEIIPPRRR